MHVHANYSQQLASLGAGRNDTQEIAARRAAEVRKKLSAASGRLLSESVEDISRVTPGNDERQDPQHREPDKEEFGRLFSARA
jgi:hypothetical protein